MESTKHDMTLTRTFDAPIEQVWKAWSDPEQVMRWWGPQDFIAPLARIDFREGGSSLVCMRGPGFGDLYNTWTYQKIVPLQQIEFVQEFANEHGEKIEPASIGLPPSIPNQVRHVVTFKRAGANNTEMTITEYGYPSNEDVEMSRAGMEQVLDKMAATFATP